ncbi:MAG: hypothetical protein AAGK04_10560 [Planctomycetota bacterium]
MPLNRASRAHAPILAFALAAVLWTIPRSAANAQADPSSNTPTPTAPAAEGSPQQPPPQAAEPGGPPEAVLILRSGRQVTGLIMGEDAESITVRIGGLDQRFRNEDVLRVTPLKPVIERYRAMRAAIGENDSTGLLKLADWLRGRERFRLALRETENVLSIDPGNAEARAKKTLLEQQIRLLERSTADADAPTTDTIRPNPGTEPTRGRASVPLLTDTQVNLLKVYELDLRDPGRLIIPRGVVDEILDRYKGQPGVPLSREGRRALYTKRPAEIAALLFSLRARELYGRIEVQEHPPAMEVFRDSVHRTWLQNACASSRCHGGTDAGRLWLATRRPNAERTFYTNFLILDRYRMLTPDRPEGVPLIDYENPERSPLLQMALTEDLSLFPHPPLIGRDARRFRTIFRSMDDPQFRKAVSWIQGMHRPRPDYPIDYVPPTPPGAMPAELRSRPTDR